MVTANTESSPQLLKPDELQLIIRSFRRTTLLRRYSHGTLKRSAMAMVNHYIRHAGSHFARPHDLHTAM